MIIFLILQNNHTKRTIYNSFDKRRKIIDKRE